MGFLGSIGLPPPVTPTQQKTLDRLKAEIDRGVKDGTLTSPESQKLYTELSQLKAQMQAPKASGWFGGAINAANEQRVNASTAALDKNIKSERTNGSVDFGKLMKSNIGVAARRIRQLGADIRQGAANGSLSPREQRFLGAKLQALQQTFMKAIKNDGKIDRTEQAQLNAMMRGLEHDTFVSERPNPFTDYVQPGYGGPIAVTQAIPEEGNQVGGGSAAVTRAIPEEGNQIGGGRPIAVTMAIPE